MNILPLFFFEVCTKRLWLSRPILYFSKKKSVLPVFWGWVQRISTNPPSWEASLLE